MYKNIPVNILFIFLMLPALLSLSTKVEAQQQEFEVLKLRNDKIKPIEGLFDDYSQILGTKTNGVLWYVYSDRDGNATYEDPENTNKVKYTLSFMEKCYVIEESGQFVRLANGTQSNNILKNASDYGWIHKRNLILYPLSIVSNNEITVKGLIINVVDELAEDFTKSKNPKVEVYKDPNLTLLSSTEIRFFNIFYIYKILKDAVLIGKQHDVQAKGGKEVILGWVPKSKVFLWNNRVALEPNWHEQASLERKGNNTRLSVFNSKRAAQIYKEGRLVNEDHIIMNWNDPGMKRSDGYASRLFVLKEFREKKEDEDLPKENEDLLKVAAIGEVKTSSGDKISYTLRNRLRRKYEKARREQKNINIVFVIEGTKDMDKYLQPIADALVTSEKLRTGSLNTYRYGVVVYGTSSSDVEVRNLTDRIEKVSDYIKDTDIEWSVGKKGVAMYAGLYAAMNRTNINKKHSNIIFVIGKHGDNTGYMNQSEIIQEAFEKNCHIIGIQTLNNDDDIVLDFQDQLQDIVTKSASKRYKFYKDEYAVVEDIAIVNAPEFDEARVEGNYSKFKLRNTSSIGVLVFPKEDEKLDSDILKSEIELNIVSADNQVNELINRMDLLINGVGSRDNKNSFNHSIIQFMIEKMGGVEEELRSVDFNQFQGAKIGYLSRVLQNQKNPLYNNVLFLDVSEIATMIHHFGELVKSVNSTNNSTKQRKELENAWMNLLMKYEGGDEAALENLKMSEINEKVFGLPGNSPFLHDIRLSEIKDLPDSTFNFYKISIEQKENQLKDIFNEGKYRFSFLSFGKRYYWISEDMLP